MQNSSGVEASNKMLRILQLSEAENFYQVVTGDKSSFQEICPFAKMFSVHRQMSFRGGDSQLGQNKR
jgi:hypothetical protein